MKTDITANVGKHAFEIAGLGTAPFKFTGMSENVFKAGDTTKAGGTCDYCGTGIRYEYHILSADGKRAKVGCDCINKSGDAGLMKAYKTHPDVRKFKREQAHAKARIVWKELKALIEHNAELLKSQPHPYGFTDRKTGAPLTRFDSVQWLFDNSGATGSAKLLKSLKASGLTSS